MCAYGHDVSPGILRLSGVSGQPRDRIGRFDCMHVYQRSRYAEQFRDPFARCQRNIKQ
jgi:hypothetical protein